MKTQTIIWQQWDNIGLEHLTLQEDSSGVLVDSVVIGIEEGVPFRLQYRIQLSEHYQVQRVDLHLAGRDPVRLTTHGAGHWFDGADQPLHLLDGCLDIDISVTPFTNTLPIRRLKWVSGQKESLHMVYIKIPEFDIRPMRQYYTCLEVSTESSFFQFDSPGFMARLPVDANGLVLDYPGLFRRV